MSITKTLPIAAFIAVFAFAGIAFAVDFTNQEFDGLSESYVDANDRIDATYRVVVPTGDTLFFVETDVTPDGRSPVCHDVGGLGEGTHFVDLELKAPATTGWFDVEVDGVSRSDTGQVVDCEDFSAGVSHDTESWSDVIRVLPAGAGSNNMSEPSEEEGRISDLEARLNQLTSLFNDLLDRFEEVMAGGGAPAVENDPLDQWSHLSMGSTGPQVSSLQAYLIGQGYSIPAIQFGGAAYGYFGPQTQAAYMSAKANSN